MFKDIHNDGSCLYYVSDYLDSSYNLHVEVTKLDMDGEYISNYEMYMSGSKLTTTIKSPYMMESLHRLHLL